MVTPDETLTIEIKNTQPLELLDLTRSFEAFAEEYRRYAETDDRHAADTNVKLYVREIRSGSVIADIAAYALAATPLFPFLEHAASLAGYARHIKKIIDFLLGNSSERPNVTKKTYEAINSFVEPVAKDSGSQLNVNVQNGNVVFNVNYTQANAVQNAARKQLTAMEEPETGEHRQVLLYWYQARNVKGASAGDKAIIESISMRPVKVAFADESLKARMIFAEDNPFADAYVVDVIVETISGRPALYKIIALHDKFLREDASTSDS